MDKLAWCKRKGLRLVVPSRNLADAYLLKAEEALRTMRSSEGRDWQISAAYYAMYFSLYSVLMRIGVKCELHACTFIFARHFLAASFTEEELTFFEKSLKARIDAQYYVDRTVPDSQHQAMLRRAPSLLVKCKGVMLSLREQEINKIRKALK
jgi:uncharacterized protein (UPF0332 family)